MSSQQSNERRPNRPLSHITFQARQLLRVNTQRAANWFKKPSLPRFKLKFPSRLSRSSPPSSSHSSSLTTDQVSIRTSSSATLHSIEPSRPRASQTRSAYNSRMVRTSPVIVPIMPTVRLSFILISLLTTRLTIIIHVSCLVLDLDPFITYQRRHHEVPMVLLHRAILT